MLTRRNIAAGLGISLVAPPALAEAITPVSLSQTPPPQAQVPPAEQPLLILDASLDQDARLTVPVSINDQGEYQFVIDTGADRSVLTPGLAERLALPRGPDGRVHGAPGSVTGPMNLKFEIAPDNTVTGLYFGLGGDMTLMGRKGGGRGGRGGGRGG
jgi:hypothetical protein